MKINLDGWTDGGVNWEMMDDWWMDGLMHGLMDG